MEGDWEDLAGKIKHLMILGLSLRKTEISDLLETLFFSINFVSLHDCHPSRWMRFSFFGLVVVDVRGSEKECCVHKFEVLPSCLLICLPQIYIEHFCVVGIVITTYTIISSNSFNLFFHGSCDSYYRQCTFILCIYTKSSGLKCSEERK